MTKIPFQTDDQVVIRDTDEMRAERLNGLTGVVKYVYEASGDSQACRVQLDFGQLHTIRSEHLEKV